MCILIIRTFQPCLHMRCSASVRCSSQLNTPGLTEYECPNARTAYIDEAPDVLCPVCEPRGIVQRLEDLLQESGQQESTTRDVGTQTETTSRSAPGHDSDSNSKVSDTASNTVDERAALDPSPSPSHALPTSDTTASRMEYTDDRRDAHEARHRGKESADEPSLASLTNEEVRELLRKELVEDGV